MSVVYHALTVLSILVFLYFGITGVFANGMQEDFERFGLSRLRLLTGTLELLGALGLIAGQFVPELAIVSAGGLALLMLLGLITRVRHRDPLPLVLPAGVLMVANVYVAWYALGLRAG